MIAEKKIEKLDNSAVKLTVTVKNDAVKDEYNTLLKKVSKEAQIKGFRKGKVPAAVVEKKYGEGLQHEAALNLIDSSIKTVFEEIDEKPLGFAQPELLDEELMLDLEKDFTFTIQYDVYPEVKLGEYKGVGIEVPKVSIGKEAIDEELKNIQEQNSVIVEKPGAIEKEDVVKMNYCEIDEEGNIVEGSERQDFVFTVGTGYNFYKIDDDVIGLKKDDEKIIEKTYDDEFEVPEYRGKTVKVKVTITKVSKKELPALDDELAQDVSDEYKTFDDLKKGLKSKLTENKDRLLRQEKITQLLDKIVEASELTVPKSMVDAELQNSWQRFVQQSRMPEAQLESLLGTSGQGKAQMMEMWRESAEKSVKEQLIVAKLLEEEKIEVADEEYDKELTAQAEASGQDLAQVKEYIEQNNLKHYITHDIQNKKLFDTLLDTAKIKEGKAVKYLDFVKEKQ